MAVTLPDELPSFLTSSEAARLLGVTRPALVKWIGQGRIEAQRPGAHWQIPAQALRAFAATWRPGPARSNLRSSASNGPEAVWEALAVLAELGPSETWELATALDRHPGNVRKYLLILRRRGFVEASSTGVNRITPAGHRHLRKEVSVAS